MKKVKMIIVGIFAVMATANFSYGQSDSKSKEISNAEKFSEKSGTLIQREFIDIGDLKKCKIQVAKFTDLLNNLKRSAVRFEYDYVSSYANDTKLALLDFDELDGLIKSIKIIQAKTAQTSTKNYNKISYKSRSGFEAGCFSKNDNWSIYLKLERFESKSYIFLDKEDLPKLLGFLEDAKEQL